MERNMNLVLGSYENRLIISVNIKLFTSELFGGTFCTISPKVSEVQRVNLSDVRERRKSNIYWATSSLIKELAIQYGFADKNVTTLTSDIRVKTMEKYIGDDSIDVTKLYNCTYITYSEMRDNKVYFAKNYSDCNYLSDLCNADNSGMQTINRDLARLISHLYNYYSSGTVRLPQMWVDELNSIMDNAPTDDVQREYVLGVCKKYYDDYDARNRW